ncbi:hypothetical protein JDO7802_03361 [Jannaschia donghaensis]|uniref:Uncharacterized protein n=2 Tax=Jannaschia donghaensis TaxID=420998 RepID=A0A0M6YLS6_9RHOB|nr:hypothetical protein JDO7802_03361 [Jannaschia donghaensis]
MKSNAAIVTAGIITFGHEAAAMFERLEAETQDAAFLALATAVADRLGTRLEGLVVHLDETTIHAHYELRGYDDAGTPISKVATFKVMSELQDLTADIMGRFCPGIERGHKKWSRINAGADYADTLNRSVRELHQDLPAEIETRKAEVELLRKDEAELEASAAKTRQYLAKLRAKAELNAKEEKRLDVYQARLAKKEAEQADVIAKLEEAMTRIAAHRAANETRAGALDAQERCARAKLAEAEVSFEAVDAVVSSLEDGSMKLRDDGGLRMADPKPLQAAPQRLKKRLLKLARRFLVQERKIEAKLSRLDRLTVALRRWLLRDDLTVDARRDGEELERDVSLGPDV